MNVHSLGYIGIETQKLAEWDDYCRQFLGFMPAPNAADSNQPTTAHRYRLDQLAWRISIESGPSEDLRFAGFDAGNIDQLQTICNQLNALGYSVEEDQELAVDREVKILFKTQDPDGLQIELFVGAHDTVHHPFRSPLGVSGFKTGEQGLGHIVLYTKDATKKQAFYMQGLGFQISDTMTLGPAELCFLHCNQRHHTLALAQAPIDRHLNHLMVEVNNLSDVGVAYDRAASLKVPITATLGCHTNDEMISFYAQTPSGCDIEYGFGGKAITENWQQTHYSSASIWGHTRDELMGSTTPE